MWWKIAIAVICGILVLSPIDFSALHFGIDDIGAFVAMVASIVSAVKSFKPTGSSKKSTDIYNDVSEN